MAVVNSGFNYKDLKVAKFLLFGVGSQIIREKLSNYGDVLKLKVPSYNGNIISG